MEEFALASHQRAVAATAAGAFAAEIVPYGGVTADECPRPDTSLAKMAALAPLREGGLITAALASQIADAAAALLVASGRAVREHGLRPLARIRHLSARGDDPVMMLTAPIAATAHALRRAGLTLGQIDLVEINEAFAPVVLAWQRETGADLARVNVCGGAIALGHPLGATGARLLTTLAARAGPDRRPVRAGDHVRGRRPGERHHHRAGLTVCPRPVDADHRRVLAVLRYLGP